MLVADDEAPGVELLCCCDEVLEAVNSTTENKNRNFLVNQCTPNDPAYFIQSLCLYAYMNLVQSLSSSLQMRLQLLVRVSQDQPIGYLHLVLPQLVVVVDVDLDG